MQEQELGYGFEQEHGFGVGSIIEYEAFGGERRRVLVDEVDSNIKNGCPGFSGKLVEKDADFGVWGYCSQVTRIVSVSS